MAGLMTGWLVGWLTKTRKGSEDSGRYAVVDFRLLLGLFVSVSNNKITILLALQSCKTFVLLVRGRKGAQIEVRDEIR